MLFKGLSAFPITPADASGRVDTEALGRLVERLVSAKVDSIGLLGSTGTYMFLTRAERRRAIAAAIESAAGRVPVIIGVGAMRTDAAEDFARDAEAGGAAGLLLAPVSYTKLFDEEVFQHFVAVSEASGLPLCIYNNPGTTNFQFSLELIARLAERSSIAAVKMPLPADGNYAGELAAIRNRVKPGFDVGYSGDWGMADAMLAGADALYSVVGGILPEPTLALVRAAQAGDTETVREIAATLAPLFALFQEFGSLRVVYAMAGLMGLTSAEPPKPILPLSGEVRARVGLAMKGIEPI